MSLAVVSSTAIADPKPSAIDIKPIRAHLHAFEDAAGGVYVVQMSFDNPDDAHVDGLWFGTRKSKQLYEQTVSGGSLDTTVHPPSWEIDVWAPRVSSRNGGSLTRTDDGKIRRDCGGTDDIAVTELTGDKASAVLDTFQLMTPAMVRTAVLLARDDVGVYYYVDRIRPQYGDKGYRLFVGRKGAMTELALTDVATDNAGSVFTAKTGSLRLDAKASAMVWITGDKRVTLTALEPASNRSVIYNDLGVYAFIGNLCENAHAK